LISSAGVLVLVAIVITAVFFSSRERDEFIEISIYYYNNEWLTEPHRVRVSGNTPQGLIEEALTRLRRLPDQLPRARALPRIIYLDAALDGRTCVVYLTDGFGAMSPSDRVITLVSLVYTLTGFEFVDDVKVMAGDTAVGSFNRGNLLLSGEHLPERVSTRVFTLYFADPTLSHLVSLDREITIQPNKPFETQLIEELISFTSTDGYRRLIPSNVRLRNNTTLDGGICYIDFSTDFLTQIDNADTVILLVHSIVNTIISNTTALQVQLLFAGDRTAAAIEAIDLDKPLTMDSFTGLDR
jgi:spore germination protein GerM